MQLTPLGADRLLDAFASQLDGGSIVIVDISDRLVTVPFETPAFHPAQGAVAVAEVSPSQIEQSGTARQAFLTTADGEVFIVATVREAGDPQIERGDVVLDRLDFHRGGLCDLTRVELTLPLRP